MSGKVSSPCSHVSVQPRRCQMICLRLQIYTDLGIILCAVANCCCQNHCGRSLIPLTTAVHFMLLGVPAVPSVFLYLMKNRGRGLICFAFVFAFLYVCLFRIL